MYVMPKRNKKTVHVYIVLKADFKKDKDYLYKSTYELTEEDIQNAEDSQIIYESFSQDTDAQSKLVDEVENNNVGSVIMTTSSTTLLFSKVFKFIIR